VAYVVVLPVLIYVVSWTGWLMHADVYERYLSDTQYGPYWGNYLKADTHGFWPELWRSLRSLWHYHHDVYSFHTGFLNQATHVYQSNPWGWFVLNRPVGVDSQLNIAPGAQGCAAAAGSTCLRQVLLLGNPVVWWCCTVALLWSVVAWVTRRDWRHGLVVVGVAATWLPWFQYDDRPIFSYYASMSLPFLLLSLVLALGEVLGREGASARRRSLGAAAAGSVVVAAMLAFAWFWPIWTDQLVTNRQWVERMWFKRWI
jgi:dolichyl-phosphate-mannose-protein mannosyltransferase